MSDYIFNSKLPCGNNIIVAIGSYSGYNQEDAVIINKNSLERGMFNTSYYKVYESFESVNKQKGNRREEEKGATNFFHQFIDRTTLENNNTRKQQQNPIEQCSSFYPTFIFISTTT